MPPTIARLPTTGPAVVIGSTIVMVKFNFGCSATEKNERLKIAENLDF
jgi:hypothetical protein